MSDDKQVNLDALAAAVTGSTAGPQANLPQAAATPFKTPQAAKVAQQSQATVLDPFEAEERAFKLEQMRRKADFEAKKQEMELEELALSIRAKKAALRKFEKDEDKDKMAEENASMDAKTKGLSIKQAAEAQRQNEKRCNHKKGGQGLHAIIGGRGDAGQYAVLKHTMSNGDMWIRCLRCGKTWKPPLERSFKNPADFVHAESQYRIAVDFQTLNTPSSSSQFTFSDHGQFYREQMEHVTLR